MDLSWNNLLFAFGLTLIAGLSTGIGSALAFFAKKTNTRFLSVALGFSAGVIIYVSMTEIFTKAKDSLVGARGVKAGSWATVAAFFGGILVITVIDKLVPSVENPHECRKIEDLDPEARAKCEGKLMRLGMFTALAIAIHNFPEGLATFTSAIRDPALGIAITVAIAYTISPRDSGIGACILCHRQQEKIALSFLSGLSEPVGAIIGYLILYPFFNDVIYGVLFAAVAGIMVFISLDELLPTAREYGRPTFPSMVWWQE